MNVEPIALLVDFHDLPSRVRIGPTANVIGDFCPTRGQQQRMKRWIDVGAVKFGVVLCEISPPIVDQHGDAQQNAQRDRKCDPSNDHG